MPADTEVTMHRVDALDALLLVIDRVGLRKVEEWVHNVTVLQGRVPRERVKPLIEHAPELLAAAIEVVRPMAICADPNCTDPARVYGEALARLTQAVAKAEGRRRG